MIMKLKLGDLLTLAVVAGLFALSWYGGEGEAYLFPQQIALAMLVIAVASVVENLVKPESGGDSVNWSLILPAVGIGVAYLMALELLGFYTSSALTFFAISLLYSRSGGGSGEQRTATIVRCALVTAGFTAALYLLFNVGLRVQTPIGWLI